MTVRFFALFNPAIIGKVEAPSSWSPAISSISFIISRIKVSPNARKHGISILFIFPNTAPEKRKVNPRIAEIIAFPINGNFFSLIL